MTKSTTWWSVDASIVSPSSSSWSSPMVILPKRDGTYRIFIINKYHIFIKTLIVILHTTLSFANRNSSIGGIVRKFAEVSEHSSVEPCFKCV